MTQQKSEWERQVHRATFKLGIWTAAWLATLALAAFGPKFIWQSDIFSLFSIIFNVLIGFGVINANRHHIAQLDELMQKITLESMAFTLGVGMVVGLGYSMLDINNLISFDAEISHLVTLLGLTYAGATVYGVKKYS